MKELLENKKSSEIIDLIRSKLDEKADDLMTERFKIVNRVRKGETQRRKKVSDREGYTYRDGKLVKMSPAERRKRSLSQKKAARKRKGKLARSLKKRKISLRKRERLS